MLMQVAALLHSQVSCFSVGVGGAHARYKAKPLREPAAHAPAFSEAEKATRSTQCVYLTLHDGSTANAARPLQLPAPGDVANQVRTAPAGGTWRETVSQSR